MYSRLILIASLVISSFTYASGQECNFRIGGEVIDEATNLPLAFVNVFIQETSLGSVTDDEGTFLFSGICPGTYHFIFSHIGCESKTVQLDVTKDSLLFIVLEHSATSLGPVVIEGQKESYLNQPSVSVNRSEIEDNTNQNIAGLLENEVGVHLLQNGSGISKPIVHGLYGNRLAILNNGIVQNGQQWGNDHSPEIDPYAADKITVLKGASAIEYNGANLGGAVLIDPSRIEREPHLHGQINAGFESNGRGYFFNTRLEKYSPIVAWRLNGTFKRFGDRKSANYFLNNTGSQEANLALQLEKSWNDQLFIDFYASTFNTELGVLRGSHIGNLTDLNSALNKEVPFFTNEDFSNAIEPPKQKVSHHLFKLNAKYFLKGDEYLDIILGTQINNRKEFDVRRSGRSDIPALSLEQITFNADIKYFKELDNSWTLKLGTQNIFTDNTNQPETGILPLIPDYFSWRSGIYSSLVKKQSKAQYNLGLRYDFENQSVASLSNSQPIEIIRYNNNFHNFSMLVAAKFDLSRSHTLSINTGYGSRNPAINELYSNGLHQGVSGIEEGAPNLNSENAIKNSLELEWLPTPDFSINILGFHQYFNNYIYLNPQNETRITIRGAFPVFSYEQTNATISGLDISSQLTLSNSLIAQFKYSYLRGQDRSNEQPLIFMPPNRIFGSLIYRAKQPLKMSSKMLMEDIEFEINNKLVFEQKHILQEQDFLPPPGRYNLLGAKFSTNLILPTYTFRFFARAENLFNIQYRDYLNRQRYFADDLGFSLTLGLSFKF